MGLLLNAVRGPESFADLRTINNRLYPSFVEAAEALGIIQKKNITSEELNELAEEGSPLQRRETLALIIKFNRPNMKIDGEPYDLEFMWYENNGMFIGDFVNSGLDPEDAIDLALKHIWSLLEPAGIRSHHCNLPYRKPSCTPLFVSVPAVSLVGSLNVGQLEIYILQCHYERS